MNGVSSRFDANEGIDAIWNAQSLALNLAPGNYSLVFAPADIPGPPGLWLLGTALAGLAARRRLSP